jgi:hypothetical protein
MAEEHITTEKLTSREKIEAGLEGRQPLITRPRKHGGPLGGKPKPEEDSAGPR